MANLWASASAKMTLILNFVFLFIRLVSNIVINFIFLGNKTKRKNYYQEKVCKAHLRILNYCVVFDSC